MRQTARAEGLLQTAIINFYDERQRMKSRSAVKTKLAMIVLVGFVAGCAPKSPYLPKEYDPAANVWR